LNDVAEFASVEGLGNDTTLSVRHDQYNDRAARIHVRRLRELIFPVGAGTSYVQVTTEINSPSYFTDVIKPAVDAPAEAPASACQFARSDLATVYASPSAPVAATTLGNPCLHSITWSGWSPPPAPCMLQGDVLYLRVVTAEKQTVHITAHTGGFYINRTSDSKFDRRMHASKPCHAQTLSGALKQLSPLFKAGFVALNAATDKHPFESLPTPYNVVPWLAHPEVHRYDEARAEDSTAIWSEADHHNPGILRDWNDELQALRELPQDTAAGRALRSRSLFKFNCDFLNTVARGAQAVVLGNVPPMNPLDEKESHMFTWNNVFFSFATDSRGIFKELGGEQAARAAAANDLRGVRAYDSVGSSELHTLATVLVDYLGHRVVAQSIVPGILRRNQTSSVVYGASEVEGKMMFDPRFNDLLAKPTEKLYTKPHTIQYGEEDTVHTIHSSSECKGILGTDERFYVLDLIRTTPMDANFVHPDVRNEHDATPPKYDLRSADEKEVEERSKTDGVVETWTPNHRLYLIRSELIAFYAEHQILEVAKKTLTASMAAANNAKEKAAAVDAPKDPAAITEALVEAVDAAAASATTGAPAAANAKATDGAGFPLLFNPDVYTATKLVGTPEEIEADRADVRKLSDYLLQQRVPKFAAELRGLRVIPFDGAGLRDAMHSNGINMRYLGQVASVCAAGGRPSQHAVTLCVTEMMARAAKHLLRKEMQTVESSNVSKLIAHFLNCMFGANTQAMEKAAKPKKKKGGKGGGSNTASGADGAGADAEGTFVGVVFTSKLTGASVWTSIVERIRVHFQATVTISGLQALIVENQLPLLRSLCQKTGVQLAAKEYNFAQNATQIVTAGSVFTPADVMCVHPTVKHSPPMCAEGHALENAATQQFNQGNLRQAHELGERAIDVFHQVYGPMHASVAKCYRLIGLVMLQSDSLEAAINSQEKATLISERVVGRDHTDTINNYVHLGQYYYMARQTARALAVIHHARNLCIVTHGSHHPEIPSINIQMARGLMDFKKSDVAVQYLDEALDVQKEVNGEGTLLEGTFIVCVFGDVHLFCVLSHSEFSVRACVRISAGHSSAHAMPRTFCMMLLLPAI
jgi:protein TIF31